MALTISRRSCCIFAIPNPARWARHADSIGSISDQRASDRSVRYARRGVFTRLLYQSNIHNGGTSAVSSLPCSYQIMPKRDEMPSKGEVIDVWYSGKRHDFGGNIQAVMRPDGLPIWVGPVEPGPVHDLTCAQDH